MPKPTIAVIVGSNRREFDQPQIRPCAGQARRRQVRRPFRAHRRSADVQPGQRSQSRPEVVRFKDEISARRRRLDRHAGAQSLDADGAEQRGHWGARPFGKSAGPASPASSPAPSPGAIGTALVQAHLRSVMLGLGMTLLGGEAYVTFKPNLFDDQGNIGDETTQKFLQGFVDRFATLVGQLSGKTA